MRASQCLFSLLALGSALASPRRSSAQARFELGPLIAIYAPVGRFGQHDTYSTSLPTKPSDLAGPAYGVEGRLWLVPRFGIQFLGALASSTFGGGIVTPAGFTTSPKDAQVLTATVQALYRPAPAGIPLWISAGAGVVRRGGQAYHDSGIGAQSPVAVAAGLGYDARVGRRFTVTVGVGLLRYSRDVKDQFGQYYERGAQTDMLAHVAFAWRPRLP